MGGGAAWVGGAALAAAAASQGAPTGPDQRGDGELWDKIASDEDVLGGLPLGVAARLDPRLVEALLLQRIVRPLSLAIFKVSRPWVPLAEVDRALKDAYIRRNESLRSRGALTASGLASSQSSAWAISSRTLVEVCGSGTAEAGALVALLRGNQRDIDRAFAECGDVLRTACSVDSDHCQDWEVLGWVLHNMAVVVRACCRDGDAEVIDAEVLEVEGAGAGDRFGAVSLEQVCEEFGAEFGAEFEHEQYVVSGHRAPSVALPGYRRMGGRIFG